MKSTWLAAYLYYNEPWHSFLINAVHPFVQQIMKDELAEEFFFIRYWERGPHIRLRFKGDPQVLETKIKPQLSAYFENWFKENPSERKEPTYPDTWTEDRYWFPNNSVQFIEYEPETERYGGPNGIEIGERHFHYCSEVILKELIQFEEWSYEQALGQAIKLHLSFAFAFKMSKKEARYFFEKIFKGWTPRVYWYGQTLSAEEANNHFENTIEAFEKAFQSQKEVLLEFHESVWEALNEGVEFESDNLNYWVQQLQNTCSEIHQADVEYPMSNLYVVNAELGIDAKHQKLWSIYNSYIHMINNRLGILNQDEGYLAYLIMKCMELLDEK